MTWRWRILTSNVKLIEKLMFTVINRIVGYKQSPVNYFFLSIYCRHIMSAILAVIFENRHLFSVIFTNMNSTSFILYESTLYFLNVLKESWDTFDSGFRRPSWPPCWKICISCYWVLHIWTVRSSFDMNWYFIWHYILKESWDTFDSEFWRPSCTAILENIQLLLLILKYLNSMSFTLYE